MLKRIFLTKHTKHKVRKIGKKLKILPQTFCQVRNVKENISYQAYKTHGKKNW